MKFRLMYAVDKDNVVLVELMNTGNDVMSATFTAHSYLLDTLGAEGIIGLKAFSILLLEDESNAN